MARKIFDMHENEIVFNDQSVLTVRKKPVIVSAFRANVRLTIHTMEGVMVGEPGDYIIKGVQGEVYPCNKDIFEQTYDIVKEK
ncbi:hypothetical protein LCGC14_1561040 [marine sediment metagenome]|uniref:Phage protein n=1 Tax=marine sediment metagenome TaxID=412755 RepID=A0A0F9J8I1_9ZZZZ